MAKSQAGNTNTKGGSRENPAGRVHRVSLIPTDKTSKLTNDTLKHFFDSVQITRRLYYCSSRHLQSNNNKITNLRVQLPTSVLARVVLMLMLRSCQASHQHCVVAAVAAAAAAVLSLVLDLFFHTRYNSQGRTVVRLCYY